MNGIDDNPMNHYNFNVDDEYSESEGPNNQLTETSPGITKCYIPICDSDTKPFVGQTFPTPQLGIKFYRNYGANCGFDVRLGTEKRQRDDTVTNRYIYCKRHGDKNEIATTNVNKDDKNKATRRKISRRFGCTAELRLSRRGKGYEVYYFEEKHSHPLCSKMYKQFMKVNRNLTPAHQNFLLDCAKVNIGPTKSFNMLKERVGGYKNVGCISNDFKKLRCELRAFVAGADAQMLLDNFYKKREISPGFFFDFELNEKDQLKRLFWADSVCRRNYAAFGDVVSFDATYSTNRYKMIFTPFTGVDCHCQIITFGAGLLSGEAEESYTWVLQKFRECMGRFPGMIITDQDPGLENALKSLIPGTGMRHRLCMWRITKKIFDKVPGSLQHDTVFQKKLDDIIWAESVEPAEHEKGWSDVMNEYDLQDHPWFIKMYEDHVFLIPAYFRDYPFSGLVKTTSVSESVNSFFGRYINPLSNLLEFNMHFDSALEFQRHAQDQLNSETSLFKPELKTPLAIERHALDVFPMKIFMEIQHKIAYACFNYRDENVSKIGSCRYYKIEEGVNGMFDVTYNEIDATCECSCKKFVRTGLLCCHIFYVFKDMKVEVIPKKFITRRWMKLSLTKATLDGLVDGLGMNCDIEEKKLLINQVFAKFYECVGMFDGDVECIQHLLDNLTESFEFFREKK